MDGNGAREGVRNEKMEEKESQQSRNMEGDMQWNKTMGERSLRRKLFDDG